MIEKQSTQEVWTVSDDSGYSFLVHMDKDSDGGWTGSLVLRSTRRLVEPYAVINHLCEQANEFCRIVKKDLHS